MESTEAIELDLQKFWLIVKRRWLTALGNLSCVIRVATVLAFLQEPVYQAQGKLRTVFSHGDVIFCFCRRACEHGFHIGYAEAARIFHSTRKCSLG